jgi:hypothetical protein
MARGGTQTAHRGREKRRLHAQRQQRSPEATFWLIPGTAGGARVLRCEPAARRLPARIVFQKGAVFDPRQQEGGAAVFPLEAILPLKGNHPEEFFEGVAEAKSRGLRVVLESFDNLLLDPASEEAVLLLTNSTAKVEETLGRLREEVLALLELADTVIATSPALAQVYGEHHPGVRSIPNAVDNNSFPEPVKRRSRVFRIGLAASASHGDDLELVAPALRWASAQPDVEVVVLGIDPRQPTWRERARALRWRQDASVSAFAVARQVMEREASWSFPFRQLPPTADYRGYMRALASFDVGLCPLAGNPWSRCRSDSKPLEYAMAGVLPVCSDAEPFHGWQWPLVQGPQGFLDRLAWCVENRDEVREHGRLWREAVLSQRSIKSTIEGWEQAVDVPLRRN